MIVFVTNVILRLLEKCRDGRKTCERMLNFLWAYHTSSAERRAPSFNQLNCQFLSLKQSPPFRDCHSIKWVLSTKLSSWRPTKCLLVSIWVYCDAVNILHLRPLMSSQVAHSDRRHYISGINFPVHFASLLQISLLHFRLISHMLVHHHFHHPPLSSLFHPRWKTHLSPNPRCRLLITPPIELTDIKDCLGVCRISYCTNVSYLITRFIKF